MAALFFVCFCGGSVPADFCADFGFTERVCSPTRLNNLLDLVLTDAESLVKTKVLPSIADHSVIEATMALSVPESVVVE